MVISNSPVSELINLLLGVTKELQLPLSERALREREGCRDIRTRGSTPTSVRDPLRHGTQYAN